MNKDFTILSLGLFLLFAMAYIPLKIADYYQESIYKRILASRADPLWTWALAEAISQKCEREKLDAPNCKRAAQVYQNYKNHTANVKEFGY